MSKLITYVLIFYILILRVLGGGVVYPTSTNLKSIRGGGVEYPNPSVVKQNKDKTIKKTGYKP